MLTGRIYGLDRQSTRGRAPELLRALNLADDRNTFAGQRSHRMRKKTAFAMALPPNPEILFLAGKCVWNSGASLEDLHFELAESANTESLEWLGSRPS